MTFTVTIPGWLPIALVWFGIVFLLSRQAFKDARHVVPEIGTPCYWFIQLGIYITTMITGVMLGMGLNG